MNLMTINVKFKKGTNLSNIFKEKLYLEMPRKHWPNQDTEQRWAEQDRILKLQQVSQEQGTEVNFMNISHLIIK